MALLRTHGRRVVFATNNSAPTTDELLGRLARLGIDADAGDLVTSARVAATLLEPGERVHVLAGGGVLEALEDRGVVVVRDERGDAAVVGWSRDFDFDALAAIATAARETGRLIATNVDPTHPTPEGLLPGSGALLAAVATASAVTPLVAGKPNPPTVTYIRDRILADGDRAVVVGDQPGTDGRLAERLGVPFALVDSGVIPPGVPVVDCPVAVRAADLVSLVVETFG